MLGTITNEIEESDDGIGLRFSFALVVRDAEPGSNEESDYAEGMRVDYLKAVSTLEAVRRGALESLDSHPSR